MIVNIDSAHRSTAQLLDGAEYLHGCVRPVDGNDWDWWKCQEYHPRCDLCQGDTHAEVFEASDTSWLFAVCDQCGNAYEFEFR